MGAGDNGLETADDRTAVDAAAAPAAAARTAPSAATAPAAAPGRLSELAVPSPSGVLDDEAGPTEHLPLAETPTVAPLARIAAGRSRAAPRAPSLDPSLTPSLAPLPSLTSAADALRDEEIERTRLFIRMGWLLSIAVMLTFPFVEAPPAMSIGFGAGLVLGMLVSSYLHRAFADPRRYTERALLVLAVICVINGHIGVLYYGAYTAAPLMVVVGIHFVARTEAERLARWIFGSALICYTAISLVILSGAIADPGVFASDRPLGRAALATAIVFVLGTFWIAYYTARAFRAVSLASIEDLQRATRLTSQREAVMNELRAELERALRVGGPGRYTDQIVGRFRLGHVLGRGAMGEVYEATRTDDGAPAAVKLLRRELLIDPTQVARFLREARAGGALASPHVVRVLDAAGADAPLPYLAMERLAGQTLAERLRHESPGAAEVVALCRQVGAGIDAAAAAGIVHRDVKPQNLFRTTDGTWKILDFGVARLADSTGTLTLGEVVGTPQYMAPEQAQGRPVDSRADLYALAAIAYRCLTGRHPFAAPDTPSLLYAVVHRMPARPGALAELPADVDRWCALALAKSPEDRFTSGAALADALAAALADRLDGRLRRRADALIRRHPWEASQ